MEYCRVKRLHSSYMNDGLRLKDVGNQSQNSLFFLFYQQDDDPLDLSKIDNTADTLFRLIDGASIDCQQDTKFVRSIRRKLFLLNQDIKAYIKHHQRCPFSRSLDKLLIRYIEFEYEALYYFKNYSVEYQEEVENKILYLLLNSFCDPKGVALKLVNTEIEASAMNALYILKNVKQEYKSTHNLIENLMKKLLRKLNILEEISKIKQKNQIVYVDKLMQVSQAKKMQKYLQSRDYDKECIIMIDEFEKKPETLVTENVCIKEELPREAHLRYQNGVIDLDADCETDCNKNDDRTTTILNIQELKNSLPNIEKDINFQYSLHEELDSVDLVLKTKLLDFEKFDDIDNSSKLYEFIEVLKRYIDESSKVKRCTARFLKVVNRSLMFFIEIMCKYTTTYNQIIKSKELLSLLVAYVETECEVFYNPDNNLKMCQEAAENRIFNFLMTTFLNPTLDDKMKKYVTKVEDISVIYALRVINGVRNDYKNMGTLVENLLKKLLRKLNVLNELTKIKLKTIDLNTNMLENPQMKKIKKLLSICDESDLEEYTEEDTNNAKKTLPIKEEVHNANETITLSLNVSVENLIIDVEDEDDDCILVCLQPRSIKIENNLSIVTDETCNKVSSASGNNDCLIIVDSGDEFENDILESPTPCFHGKLNDNVLENEDAILNKYGDKVNINLTEINKHIEKEEMQLLESETNKKFECLSIIPNHKITLLETHEDRYTIADGSENEKVHSSTENCVTVSKESDCLLKNVEMKSISQELISNEVKICSIERNDSIIEDLNLQSMQPCDISKNSNSNSEISSEVQHINNNVLTVNNEKPLVRSNSNNVEIDLDKDVDNYTKKSNAKSATVSKLNSNQNEQVGQNSCEANPSLILNNSNVKETVATNPLNISNDFKENKISQNAFNDEKPLNITGEMEKCSLHYETSTPDSYILKDISEPRVTLEQTNEIYQKEISVQKNSNLPNRCLSSNNNLNFDPQSNALMFFAHVASNRAEQEDSRTTESNQKLKTKRKKLIQKMEVTSSRILRSNVTKTKDVSQNNVETNVNYIPSAFVDVENLISPPHNRVCDLINPLSEDSIDDSEFVDDLESKSNFTDLQNNDLSITNSILDENTLDEGIEFISHKKQNLKDNSPIAPVENEKINYFLNSETPKQREGTLKKYNYKKNVLKKDFNGIMHVLHKPKGKLTKYKEAKNKLSSVEIHEKCSKINKRKTSKNKTNIECNSFLNDQESESSKLTKNLEVLNGIEQKYLSQSNDNSVEKSSDENNLIIWNTPTNNENSAHNSKCITFECEVANEEIVEAFTDDNDLEKQNLIINENFPKNNAISTNKQIVEEQFGELSMFKVGGIQNETYKTSMKNCETNKLTKNHQMKNVDGKVIVNNDDEILQQNNIQINKLNKMRTKGALKAFPVVYVEKLPVDYEHKIKTITSDTNLQELSKLPKISKISAIENEKFLNNEPDSEKCDQKHATDDNLETKSKKNSELLIKVVEENLAKVEDDKERSDCKYSHNENKKFKANLKNKELVASEANKINCKNSESVIKLQNTSKNENIKDDFILITNQELITGSKSLHNKTNLNNENYLNFEQMGKKMSVTNKECKNVINEKEYENITSNTIKHVETNIDQNLNNNMICKIEGKQSCESLVTNKVVKQIDVENRITQLEDDKQCVLEDTSSGSSKQNYTADKKCQSDLKINSEKRINQKSSRKIKEFAVYNVSLDNPSVSEDNLKNTEKKMNLKRYLNTNIETKLNKSEKGQMKPFKHPNIVFKKSIISLEDFKKLNIKINEATGSTSVSNRDLYAQDVTLKERVRKVQNEMSDNIVKMVSYNTTTQKEDSVSHENENLLPITDLHSVVSSNDVELPLDKISNAECLERVTNNVKSNFATSNTCDDIFKGHLLEIVSNDNTLNKHSVKKSCNPIELSHSILKLLRKSEDENIPKTDTAISDKITSCESNELPDLNETYSDVIELTTKSYPTTNIFKDIETKESAISSVNKSKMNVYCSIAEHPERLENVSIKKRKLSDDNGLKMSSSNVTEYDTIRNKNFSEKKKFKSDVKNMVLKINNIKSKKIDEHLNSVKSKIKTDGKYKKINSIIENSKNKKQSCKPHIQLQKITGNTQNVKITDLFENKSENEYNNKHSTTSFNNKYECQESTAIDTDILSNMKLESYENNITSTANANINTILHNVSEKNVNCGNSTFETVSILIDETQTQNSMSGNKLDTDNFNAEARNIQNVEKIDCNINDFIPETKIIENNAILRTSIIIDENTDLNEIAAEKETGWEINDSNQQLCNINVQNTPTDTKKIDEFSNSDKCHTENYKVLDSTEEDTEKITCCEKKTDLDETNTETCKILNSTEEDTEKVTCEKKTDLEENNVENCKILNVTEEDTEQITCEKKTNLDENNTENCKILNLTEEDAEKITCEKKTDLDETNTETCKISNSTEEDTEKVTCEKKTDLEENNVENCKILNVTEEDTEKITCEKKTNLDENNTENCKILNLTEEDAEKITCEKKTDLDETNTETCKISNSTEEDTEKVTCEKKTDLEENNVENCKILNVTEEDTEKITCEKKTNLDENNTENCKILNLTEEDAEKITCEKKTDLDETNTETCKISNSTEEDTEKVTCEKKTDLEENNVENCKILNVTEEDTEKITCENKTNLDENNTEKCKVLNSTEEDTEKITCEKKTDLDENNTENCKILNSTEEDTEKITCEKKTDLDENNTENCNILNSTEEDTEKITCEKKTDLDENNTENCKILNSTEEDTEKITCEKKTDLDENNTENCKILNSTEEDTEKITCEKKTDLDENNTENYKILNVTDEDSEEITCEKDTNLDENNTENCKILNGTEEDTEKITYCEKKTDLGENNTENCKIFNSTEKDTKKVTCCEEKLDFESHLKQHQIENEKFCERNEIVVETESNADVIEERPSSLVPLICNETNYSTPNIDLSFDNFYAKSPSEHVSGEIIIDHSTVIPDVELPKESKNISKAVPVATVLEESIENGALSNSTNFDDTISYTDFMKDVIEGNCLLQIASETIVETTQVTPTSTLSDNCENADSLIQAMFSQVTNNQSNDPFFIYLEGTDHNYHSVGDPLLSAECGNGEIDHSNQKKDIPTSELDTDDNMLQELTTSLNESSVNNGADFQFLDQCLIEINHESNSSLQQRATCDNVFQNNLKQEVNEYVENNSTNNLEFVKDSAENEINTFQQTELSTENMNDLMNALKHLNHLTSNLQNNESLQVCYETELNNYYENYMSQYPDQEVKTNDESSKTVTPTSSKTFVNNSAINSENHNKMLQNSKQIMNLNKSNIIEPLKQTSSESNTRANFHSDFIFLNNRSSSTNDSKELTKNKKVIVEHIPPSDIIQTLNDFTMNDCNINIKKINESTHVVPNMNKRKSNIRLPVEKKSTVEPTVTLSDCLGRHRSFTPVLAPKRKIVTNDNSKNVIQSKIENSQSCVKKLQSPVFLNSTAKDQHLFMIDNETELNIRKSCVTLDNKNNQTALNEHKEEGLSLKDSNSFVSNKSKSRPGKEVTSYLEDLNKLNKDSQTKKEESNSAKEGKLKDLKEKSYTNVKTNSFEEILNQNDMIDNIKCRKRKHVSYVERPCRSPSRKQQESFEKSQKAIPKKIESEEVINKSKGKRKKDIDDDNDRNKTKSSNFEQNKMLVVSDASCDITSSEIDSCIDLQEVSKNKKPKLEPRTTDAIFDWLKQDGDINEPIKRDSELTNYEQCGNLIQKLDQTVVELPNLNAIANDNIFNTRNQRSSEIKPKKVAVVAPIPSSVKREPLPCLRSVHNRVEDFHNTRSHHPYYSTSRSNRSHYHPRESSRSRHQESNSGRRKEYASHSNDRRYALQNSNRPGKTTGHDWIEKMKNAFPQEFNKEVSFDYKRGEISRSSHQC